MKKHVLLVMALLAAAAALLVLAACAPVPSAPAATATTAPVAATPAAPATQAVSLTVAAPVTETVPLTSEPLGTPAPAGTPTPDTRPTVPAPVEGERPLAKLSPPQRENRFSGPAAKYVKDNTVYIATIVTDKGNIVAELYQDTPGGENNFVTLALNGFYDGLTFHRVEPNFVIQGGDPSGTGNGGPGYTIPAEIKHTHPRGALAWARTGDQINPERASSGSQFYITLAETPFLDGAYSVFGYVLEGMDVADKIAVGDKIQRIDITTASASKLPTPTPSPTPFAPAVQEGRPLATVEVAKREGYFNSAPAMTIDTTKKYEATIETDKGNIVMELDPSLAPKTVNNFVMLANLGYFDNMPVAHVQEGTYAIFGSPASSPASDVGYQLPPEGPTPSSVVTGTVAMYPVQAAGGQIAASGGQFFISFAAIPESATPLNVFGKVTQGLDVAQKLVGASAQPPVNAQGTPEAAPKPDVIKTITITQK